MMPKNKPILDYAAPITDLPQHRGRVKFQNIDGGIRLIIEPIGFIRYHARVRVPLWTLGAALSIGAFFMSEPPYALLLVLLPLAVLELCWLWRVTRGRVILAAMSDELLISAPSLFGRHSMRWNRDRLLGIRFELTMPGAKHGHLLVEVRRPLLPRRVRLLLAQDREDVECVAQILRRELRVPENQTPLPLERRSNGVAAAGQDSSSSNSFL